MIIKKVDCLKCEKKHYTNGKEKLKTFIDTRIIPVSYIVTHYGNVENFIEREKGRTYEADNYTIIQSRDYDYNKYKNYIDSDNKILKAIESVRNNTNIVNKNDVLEYLLTQI